MFTSRSEYRLLLRSDKLTEVNTSGLEVGCVGKNRKKLFREKTTKIKKGFKIIKNLNSTPNQLKKNNIKIKLDGKTRSAFELLSYKDINFKNLEKIWPELKNLDAETKEQIQIESIYSSYLSRQRADIEDFKKEEGLKIPKLSNTKRLEAVE